MKWQYQVYSLDLDHPNQMQRYLNTQGAQGWELVSVTTEQTQTGLYLTVFLKRQVS